MAAARRISSLALLAAAVLLVQAPPVFAADELHKQIRKQEKRLASELRSLLSWSAKKKITGFRHRLYGLLLMVEPTHRGARRALEYERGMKGWEQSPRYTPPKDWDLAKRQKGEAKLQGVLAAHRDALLELLDETEGLAPERRAAVIDRLLELNPDDATLREERGEILYEGRWLLPETITAGARRAELADVVSTLSSKARAAIREDPEAMKGGWSGAYRLGRREAFGSVDPDEVLEALVSVVVADGLASRLLETKPGRGTLVGPRTTMMMGTRREAISMAKVNKFPPEVIELLSNVSATVHDGTAIVFSSDPFLRRSAAARYIIHSHIRRRVGSHERGWLVEGVGQRILWHIEGRNGMSFANFDRTERLREGNESTLPADAEDWLPAAADVLREEGPRRLARVLTARLNAMTAKDVLVAYGLAAYLLEARPDLAADFMKATAEGHDVEATAQKYLGAGLATVAKRLVLWLPQQN